LDTSTATRFDVVPRRNSLSAKVRILAFPTTLICAVIEPTTRCDSLGKLGLDEIPFVAFVLKRPPFEGQRVDWMNPRRRYHARTKSSAKCHWAGISAFLIDGDWQSGHRVVSEFLPTDMPLGENVVL
jgi:hypothetical protein